MWSRSGASLCLAIVLTSAPGRPAAAASTNDKVLHIAFNTAENGFDPARLSDNTSLVLTTHLLKDLRLRPLARRSKWGRSVRCRCPPVWLTSDLTIPPSNGIGHRGPAFKGKSREWRRDFVYSIKRYAERLRTLEHIEKAKFRPCGA